MSWMELLAVSALLVSGCAAEEGTQNESMPGGGTGGVGGLATGGVGGASGTSSMIGTGGSAGAAGSLAGSGGTAGIATGGMGGAGLGGMGGAAAMSATGGTGGMVDPVPTKFVGNITTRGSVRPDFVDHWDQITPENEGKWESVEGTRDDMRWDGLDAVYDYAKANNIPFKQHTFVWGSQQPRWIAGLSQTEQREEVEEWIRLFCERYPDTQMIDVVNEPPPHTTPSYAAALGGDGASGYDWIVQAFEWADQYCPNSILILNDYNTLEFPNDNDHFIDIVNRIVAAGAPIDAIGAQAHEAFDRPTDTVRMYIDKLAATGLPVYISEYDINLADDEQQRQVMESQLTMFWEHEDVAGITLWGYVEGRTWRPNTGLITESGEPRPAMTWLMGFLSR